MDKMKQLGLEASISSAYDNFLRPLNKQGIIDYSRSVLNGKENLYYPANNNSDNENGLPSSLFPLTEDCRLILSKPFDEKKVLEESLETLLERRRNGGGAKYKIVDTDGSEMSLSTVIEKYFSNSEYLTSCSVVLTKFYNNIIGESSIDKPNLDLQEKTSSNALFDNSINAVDTQEEKQKEESFECYYCPEFSSTTNKREYEKHMVSKHIGKTAYPGLADLEKYNLEPKGKKWEI
jgi:hypothetical protein